MTDRDASAPASRIIPAELCAARVPGRRVDVLRVLARRALDSGYTRPSFPRAVLARELDWPTGLATVVPSALPHTDTAHVLRAGLAVATTAEPVEFLTMGGRGEVVRVSLVLMPLVTDPEGQTAAITAVLDLLSDRERAAPLLEAADDEALSVAASAAFASHVPGIR
jgi:galactitol PTS system EIIA component